MAILEGKCPNCGAALKVDTNDDASICEFCGTPFITEKAINVKGDYIQNITNINTKQDNEYSAEIEESKSNRALYKYIFIVNGIIAIAVIIMIIVFTINGMW